MSNAARSNDGYAEAFGDKLQIRIGSCAVPVNTCEQYFTSPPLNNFLTPQMRIFTGIIAPAVGEGAPASIDSLCVDMHADRLTSKVRSQLVNERGPFKRSSVKSDLICSCSKEPVSVR